MIVRSAYFEGEIKAEGRARFEQLVKDELAPRMRELPNIRRLCFYFGKEYETEDRPICFVVEHGYDSLDDVNTAKASPAREAITPALEELMTLFEGRVYHVNHEMDAIV